MKDGGLVCVCRYIHTFVNDPVLYFTSKMIFSTYFYKIWDGFFVVF